METKRIIFTVANEPQSHLVETQCGPGFRACRHGIGLYYGFGDYQDEPRYHQDLAALAKLVEEEESEVVVLGSGSERDGLFFSTIDVARYLLKNTAARSVITFTVTGFGAVGSSTIGFNYEQHVFEVQLYEMTRDGLRTLGTMSNAKPGAIYGEVAKLATIRLAPK